MLGEPNIGRRFEKETAVTTTLSASLEDYLEAVYLIIQERQVVRSKDIAAHLEVTTASVTGALRALAERGLINYEPYGAITLTPKGRKLGRQLLRTHESLRAFLVDVLAVEPEHANEAACRMEHAIPDDILERFVRFTEFIDLCPHAGATWVRDFGFHCKDTGRLSQCTRCVTDELEATRLHRLGHRDG